MTHAGQEITLGPIRHICLVDCLRQLMIPRVQQGDMPPV